MYNKKLNKIYCFLIFFGHHINFKSHVFPVIR